MPGSGARPGPLIVLHMGFHKTGGAGLQKALLTHRADLAPQFAVATRSTDKPLALAADAARDFSERSGAQRRAALVAALTTWAESIALAPGQGLIVSCEGLSGQVPGFKDVASYAALPGIARLLVQALRQRFGEGLDLRLFFSTRGAEDWLRAVHWHLARQPGFEVFLDRFARDHARAADFGAILQDLRAALPDLRIASAPVKAEAGRRLGLIEALYDLAEVPAEKRAGLRRVPEVDDMPLYDLSGAFVALNRAAIPRETLKRLKLALMASAELDRDLGD